MIIAEEGDHSSDEYQPDEFDTVQQEVVQMYVYNSNEMRNQMYTIRANVSVHNCFYLDCCWQ